MHEMGIAMGKDVQLLQAATTRVTMVLNSALYSASKFLGISERHERHVTESIWLIQVSTIVELVMSIVLVL